MRTRLLVFTAVLVASAAPGWCQIRPEQVAILENQSVRASLRIGKLYRKLRGVPEENVIRFPMSPRRTFVRDYYNKSVAKPIAEWLRAHGNITTLLVTYGVPYRIEGVRGKPQTGAAFDNEIAVVLEAQRPDPYRWEPNPLFVRGKNVRRSCSPRRFGMVFVSRLDGPSEEIVERIIRDSIAAERVGLAGKACVDARSIPGATGYGMGDVILRKSLARLSGAGFPYVFDERPATWKAGPAERSAVAEGAAYYAGWYDLRNFQDIFGEKGLARGAIAWHLASFEAIDIWSPREKGWVANLLRRGAAVSWGPAFEPYLQAYPRAGVVLDLLLQGRSIAEAYWLGLPHVSWAMVLIGDPLYRPFAAGRPAVLAGAYRVAGSAGPEPRPGEKVRLLVRLRAVGRPGSRVPALQGLLRAGKGVTLAGGTVRVPSLAAGAATVIETPPVEVKGRLGDLFRLHLDLEDAGGTTRDVILEGRVGMARLTGGEWACRVLLADPTGKRLVAGTPFALRVVTVSDLEDEELEIDRGEEPTGGGFSPDGRFLALVTKTLEGGRRSRILRASSREDIALAGRYEFLGWLHGSAALLARTAGASAARRGAPPPLAVLDAATGKLDPVPRPEGWLSRPLGEAGNLFLLDRAERIAFCRPGGNITEVLRGKGPFRTASIAADLSCFEGLDLLGNLWVQYGLEGKPAVIGKAAGNRVFWGPISRRFAWSDGTKGHVHDGAARKTHDVPAITSGWWSSDESRFLYLSPTEKKKSPELRLWQPGGDRKVIEVGSLGALGVPAFSGDGRRILAVVTPDLEQAVWSIDLSEDGKRDGEGNP